MSSPLIARLARLSCGVVLLASTVASGLAGQTPSAPGDTASARPTRDSTSVRPRPVDSPLMLLVVPAGLLAMVVLYFAPGTVALCPCNHTAVHHPVSDQHAIAMAVGGAFHGGQTWTNAVDLEGNHGNLLGEVTVEDFWRPRHVQYVSVRGGYLRHPRDGVAGGVTIGYMHADAERAQRGPEVGLPLIIDNAAGTDVRFEPTYVIGRRGLLFNYRAQVRVQVARSRYFLGASFVGKGDPPPSSAEYPGDFTGAGYMLLLGSRF